MRTSFHRFIAVASVSGLALAACGSDDTSSSDEPSAAAPAADADAPTIVVTTNILGDVVSSVVGASANVVTIMPVGADPHDFQASAQEVDAMTSADALIVNGAAFEEGLLDVIENARDEGVPTYEAIASVDTIEFGEGGHDHGDEDHDDDHGDEEHGDEDHDDEHGDDDQGDDDEEEEDEDDDDDDDNNNNDNNDNNDDDDHDDHDHAHDHDVDDPHFFTDPMRMHDAVEGIVGFLNTELSLDVSADSYLAELDAVDAEVAERVGGIPDEQRVLVTNHEVFGYFADRYDFEVIGAVIPAGGTTESASAGELAELAELIEAEGVPAIFSDTSASDELAQPLADEVGDIEVIELFTESLGDGDSDGATYLDMVRANAERIAGALA